MNKLLFILLIALMIALFKPQLSLAQENTSTKSGDIENQEVLDKIKERIEENITGTSNSHSATDSATPTWYGSFGTVTTTGNNKIVVQNQAAQNTEILFDQNVELVLFKSGVGRSEITADDIETGWFAIAMGKTITNNKNLLAQRITFTQDFETPAKSQVVAGKITEIDEEAMTISNGKTYALEIPEEYNLKIKGVDRPNLEDISIDDRAVAIATVADSEDKEGEKTYTLRAVYIIPSLSNPLAEENQVENEATASAKEATKSAKPKEN
ncbi:hypothetical protein GYA49_02750 [Candidatus Beckwithbacteria bacterium]|nr:hypothetical protein [Candidatus Beckwithbacteria bacterium]